MTNPNLILVACCLVTALMSCSPDGATASESTDSRPTSQETPKSNGKKSETAVADDKALERVLSAAVKDGKVNYTLLRKTKADLDAYVAFAAKAKISDYKTNDGKLAFYTNAYNANVLSMVRDRPKLVSVVKEKGFFDKILVEVAGSKTTLNDLEGKARALGDPRMHFIVNCASGSCPILESKSFQSEGLSARLKAATTRYLTDKKHGMEIDAKKKVVKLSNIFNWYAKDFAPSGKPADVLTWISNQLEGELKKQLTAGGYKVEWKEYDWSLNKN